MASRGAIAIAALLAAGACGAAELGTLFHTPEERAQLDRLRRGEPTQPPPAAGESRTPVVTGYVRRSDGRHTVWVDGAPLATRQDPRTFDPRTLPRRNPESTSPPPEPPPAGAGSPPAANPTPPRS